MLPSDAFVATIGNGINKGGRGSILLQGRGLNQILRIESSGLQVIGGKNFTNSFVVTGFAEGNNLIAVKVMVKNDKGTSCVRVVTFLLSIGNKEGRLSVNTKENFLAFENGRLGAIDDNGYITMQISEDIFTTNPEHEGPHHFISEKNVCCKYLAGHISAGEVTRSAEFTEAAKKAQQGKELALQKEIDALREELEKQEIDFEAKCNKLRKEKNDAWGEMIEWQSVALQMRNIIKPLPCYDGDSNPAERVTRWLAFRKILKTIVEESPLLNGRGGMLET